MDGDRDKGCEGWECRCTQDRILNAAAKVFAERGYKAATIRMICAEAEVNVALVNYYFKSKAELYKAVIAKLFENVAKPMMAIPDAVRDETTWREAIRSWVRRAIAICAATRPPESWVARLMGMESCVPSDMAQDIDRKFSVPMRQCFRRLLSMAIDGGDLAMINLWHSSINAQCVVYALAKPGWAERFCPPEVEREKWLDMVAEHICEGVFARLSFRGKV
ncbi:MAG: CerR family C-terminal domain-containing protein [Kiritimatiellae bacterium]|nr:CerR family C-terminal domain-containing protein [Kiritimatiellia bacterium]